MLRASCLAMTVCGTLLGYALAEDTPKCDANAALRYWQAFATLPRFTDAEGQKINAEALTMPLDGHAREIVTKAEYSLDVLQRGATLPRCDWGIDYEKGIYTRLPHVPAARVLAALACLRARIRFESAQDDQALDDVIAAMALSRHVSQGGDMIVVLTGYAAERGPIDTLALYLPKLKAQAILKLTKRLTELPAGGRPATAMQTETGSFLNDFVRSLKDAKDKESLVTLLGLTSGSEGGASKLREQGTALLAACGGDASGVVKFTEELRPSYGAVEKMLDLPLDQFEREFDIVVKKQAANPLFKAMFPPLINVRRAQARAEVRRGLLMAALAIGRDGQGALEQHPDPVMGGVFEYLPFKGGFELRSKLKQSDGSPVLLTVGRRGG
jgi:hypothetical protein